MSSTRLVALPRVRAAVQQRGAGPRVQSLVLLLLRASQLPVEVPLEGISNDDGCALGEADEAGKSEHRPRRLTHVPGVGPDERPDGQVRSVAERLLDLPAAAPVPKSANDRIAVVGTTASTPTSCTRINGSAHMYTMSVDLRCVMMHPGGGWLTTFAVRLQILKRSSFLHPAQDGRRQQTPERAP